MVTADLHIHSEYSYDSVQSPKRMLAAAKRRGLDAIAVTDHDEFDGVQKVAESAEDVLVVPGMEVRTRDYDDLLALFIETPIESRSFEAAVEEIHAQGGLAVLPHPFRKFSEVPSWVLELVDAIEGLNARSKPKWNRRAQSLGRERNLVLLGGSDAHTSFEVGAARTVIPDVSEVTLEGIKAAIEAGTVEYAGSGTPYYVSHGVSVATELLKGAIDGRRE